MCHEGERPVGRNTVQVENVPDPKILNDRDAIVRITSTAWLPHVALCLFELGSLALTDPTGKGDFHGDVDAIRRANMEEPAPHGPHGRARRRTGGCLRPVDLKGGERFDARPR